VAINLEWSEYVTSFDQADLTVTAGVVSNFNVDELGWLYSFAFTPDDEGVAATLAVHPAINQDQALNDNVASNSLYFLFDGIPPEVNLSSTNTFTFYTRQAIDILVEFAEPMFQFVASDVVVKDSTYDDSGPIVVDDFVSTNSGATYTATVNPAEGNVTIYVPAASAVDANDNINAYSNTIEFIFDTTGPAPYLNTTISHTEATLDLWTDDTLRTQVP
jgi:hypothetical protein